MPKMSDVFQPFKPIWGISVNLLGLDGSFTILAYFPDQFGHGLYSKNELKLFP